MFGTETKRILVSLVAMVSSNFVERINDPASESSLMLNFFISCKKCCCSVLNTHVIICKGQEPHPTQQRPPHSNFSGFPRAPCGLGSAHLLRFHTNCGIQLVSVPLKMFKIQSSPNIQQNQCLIHQNELLATQWMFFLCVCVWIIAAPVNCLKSANLQETFAINWFFLQTLPW